MVIAAKALMWQLAVWLLSFLVLFLPAGRLTWLEGWTFFLVFFGFVLLLSGWLLRHDGSLLAERLTIFKTGQPGWDRVWLGAFYLLSLAWLALMPLDAARWHWSQMPVFLQGIGLLLLLCSLSGVFVTIRENRYLSPVVRLQEERGQTVISSGPYRYIRHPLYAAASLFYVGVPLLMGAWSGLALSTLFIGLMAYRAVQEEHLLCSGLAGYDRYLKQVRRRFIPWIW